MAVNSAQRAPAWMAVTAQYLVTCDPQHADTISQEIALEQTVEVPAALVTSAEIWEQVVGRVEAIEPLPDKHNAFLVRIAYNLELTGHQLPQLLNLIYGNISLKQGVRLVNLDLPDAFLAGFRGPKFGVDGLREQLGVHGRPLLATALKPVGSTPQELAAVAADFALGGGDVVKDDHNLHDASLRKFFDRVRRVHDAVEQANARTGRRTWYLPNLMLPVEQLPEALEFLVRHGIPGVLAAPSLLGMDQLRAISEKYPLFMMLHPTHSGANFQDPRHGIEPGLLLGQLYRLLGADASIFPNVGGRFTFTNEDCAIIARQLRSPLGVLAPAWPAPAGGMKLENIPRMAEMYGPDAMFLIGGALLSHSQNLADSTRRFLERIEQLFPTTYTAPAAQFGSTCELPAQPSAASASDKPELQHLAFKSDFSWDGRTAQVYKNHATLPFQNVSRHELIAGSREQTAFDLRYFQIEPGGYSSQERHVHTHTIICVRGAGELLCGDRQLQLTQHDIAYVPPLAVHQLRNSGTEPFGFFCIVDHNRDRPQAP